MSESQTKFGILLPTREVILSGRADPSSLYDLADRTEALGFHSVWVGDSVVAKPRLDALTTLAAVGARTHRIRLGTAVYLAALRNPVLVAHMVGTVDWLSRGRVDLGIGYSRPNDPVQEDEYRVLGHDPAKRIKISEELVHIIRRLWREKDVSYAGNFSSFEHVTVEPKPIQIKSCSPINVGCTRGLPILSNWALQFGNARLDFARSFPLRNSATGATLLNPPVKTSPSFKLVHFTVPCSCC